MHSKYDKIKTMINDEENEVIKEFFDSLKHRYQNHLLSMGGPDFIIDFL